MKKTLVEQIIKYGYSLKSAYAILQGKRKPRYEIMLKLHQDGIVPFEAWLDIKSYLNSSDKEVQDSNTIKKEEV